MKISNDSRVDKQIRALSDKDNSRVVRMIELFRDQDFALSQLYLKKLTKTVWELRAGRYRLLFGTIEAEAVIVNIFIKKTQKTPKKEIELAIKRLKEYL